MAQIDKLESFSEKRILNFNLLKSYLMDSSKRLILPEATTNSSPSWFGFPITLDESICRNKFLRILEEKKIGTRLLFAGNVTKQPYFRDIPYRVNHSLVKTDKVMEKTFWIGTHPRIGSSEIEYMADIINQTVKELTK